MGTVLGQSEVLTMSWLHSLTFMVLKPHHSLLY